MNRLRRINGAQSEFEACTAYRLERLATAAGRLASTVPPGAKDGDHTDSTNDRLGALQMVGPPGLEPGTKGL